MKLGLENWRSFERGIEKEYLETNGLGSFCSSTVIGANIRKYHALLNASMVPPINRMVLLSKLDEEVTIGNENFSISSNEYAGRKEEGYKYLRSFSKDLLPKFDYAIGDVSIEKTIAMQYGKNTTVICYKVRTGRECVSMRFTPHVNYRDHHSTSKKGSFTYSQHYDDNVLHLIEQETKLDLKILSNCSYEISEGRTLPIFYRNEAERGLSPIDFHYIPGYFKYEMEPHGEYMICFAATTEEELDIAPASIIREEEIRRRKLIDKAGCKNPMLRALVLAADQFIVKRFSTGTKTVIAGYPWFTDWGRDTMIAFTGLTLAAGRFEDAREILLTFTKHIKHGLLPNMFPDEGCQPIYNTADATLWFFYAVYKYLQYTKDEETVRTEIYPKLKEIIEHHRKGTMFDIYMEEDGLLSAGSEGTQLTWMDVKAGDWVVTPRHGKAVEINALWYNALKIMEKLSESFEEEGSWYRDTAQRVKKSFNEQFWNRDKQCLFDVIQKDKRIDSMRPNQIIAVSLPFEILEKDKWRIVVQKVHEKLYTPYGLRTLSKDEKDYKGIYIGDVLRRDGAYHRGTVWPWLIGPFVDAYLKVNGRSESSREQIKEMLELFYGHMGDACIGSISEILDGDEPFYPRGCMAQAWSVAEVLRAYIEADKGVDEN